MLSRKTEEILKPIIKKFVGEVLARRYESHASDPMIVSLILSRLGEPSRRESDKCLGQIMTEGDPNAAYEAARWLFETVLEHGCRAGGNGHHVAQSFSEYVGLELSAPMHSNHVSICCDCLQKWEGWGDYEILPVMPDEPCCECGRADHRFERGPTVHVFRLDPRVKRVAERGPDVVSTIKSIPPNPDVIRLTEKIVDQNRQILEMNKRLLSVLQAQPMVVTPERM